MIPGTRCAYLSDLVSLVSSSFIVLVVNIRALAGWKIVFVVNCVTDLLAGTTLANNDTFTAESTRAVVFM